ncbi:Protein Y73F8A.35 b [Aphelenchoides avenae]|nr:Protein Y73F8A.35 b [Aphelenchus avenae]
MPKNATIRPPDVHILIFDSVSSAQLMRSMPKSLRFLEEELGAINFRYLNKVAHNSRPNGYAMFLGRLHNASGDTDEWALCKKALDNEPFIGFEYRRRGYKTMMAEDYGQGWNWPGCKGFEKTHFDHYMKPFQLLYRESKGHEAWQKKLMDDQCRGMHLYLFDYFKGFLVAYADEPKFSIMWPVDIAHDNVTGLYQVDGFFLKMLKDYKEKGEIEDNNPALVVAVPEHLRRNKQLMANLKANSRQLTTHYDNHATWVNIARECDKMASHSPFDRLDTSTWNVSLLGESYLYPFDLSKPRNCANLRVYSGYCICQNEVKVQ